MNPKKNSRGVTVIELLVVVAILGIVFKFAFQSYTDYIVGTKRDVAKACLVELSQSMERYFTANNSTYVGASVWSSDCQDSVSGAYTFSFAATPTQNTFSLRATAIDGQLSKDGACSPLNLDHLNTKTPAACWN